MKKKPKKTGRPSRYHKRYCRMLIHFFDIEPFTTQLVPHYDESGKKHKSGPKKGEQVVTWIETKREANRTPTLERFAKKINVNIATVYRWIDEKHASFHKDFCEAFARARELRKWFLVENELQGAYKSSSNFKYIANNVTDMTEVQKQEITGADGGMIKIQVVHFAKANIDNDDGGSPSTD